jgi:hypothetical protein
MVELEALLVSEVVGVAILDRELRYVRGHTTIDCLPLGRDGLVIVVDATSLVTAEREVLARLRVSELIAELASAFIDLPAAELGDPARGCGGHARCRAPHELDQPVGSRGRSAAVPADRDRARRQAGLAEDGRGRPLDARGVPASAEGLRSGRGATGSAAAWAATR